jgi:opine dehydrogenase
MRVAVANIRDRVDMAGLPAATTPAGAVLCQALFGDRFVQRQDLLAIALSNVNPQNHLAMALCNLTRIEKGEDWGNYAGITPSVGRLMEALDAERLAIAATFGRTVRTLREHFHLSFHVPLLSVAEMAHLIDARGNAPLGPKTMQNRYVLEDIPYGIVATEMLAGIAGVKVPLHQAGIEMFGALYGKNFRQENDILPDLGLHGLAAADLSAIATSGFSG